MKDFWAKIPEEHKQKVALLITLLAGLIIIPLWFWNMDYANTSGDVPKINEQKSNNSFSFKNIPNPLAEVDAQFKNQFNQPFEISKTESTADEYYIYFKAENKSLADLVFQGQKSILRRSDQPGPDYNPKKVLTLNGQQFAPMIPAGEVREGVLVFPKIESGLYLLILNDLVYQDENQDEFDQVLELEIEQEVWLPRT